MREAGELWDKWTHSLNSKNAVLQPLANDAELDQYDKCIGLVH